jgi:hypothetical protein
MRLHLDADRGGGRTGPANTSQTAAFVRETHAHPRIETPRLYGRVRNYAYSLMARRGRGTA